MSSTMSQPVAPDDPTAANVAVVRCFLEAFDGRWPNRDELSSLVAADVSVVERPNLVNPAGSTRTAAELREGVEAGSRLLAWQSYDVRDHVACGEWVVSRFRWTGELAVDVGSWRAGTRLAAWCVGHYRLRDGLIVSIEQHDCYEQLAPPS
jgi:hypothetical protein